MSFMLAWGQKMSYAGADGLIRREVRLPKMHFGEEDSVRVKDIADCVSFDRSDHGISKTIRQVRHWTQSDLLRPVGQKNTGTGVPRVYPEEPTLQIAAILMELSRYGATVDILKPVSEALYEEMDEFGHCFFIAMTDEGEAFAQVAWTEDPATGRLIDADISFITIETDRKEGEWLTGNYSSSITINLNKVMSRIFPWPRDK